MCQIKVKREMRVKFVCRMWSKKITFFLILVNVVVPVELFILNV